NRCARARPADSSSARRPPSTPASSTRSPRRRARASRPSVARRAAALRGAPARRPRRAIRLERGRSRISLPAGDARLDQARPLAVRRVEADFAEHLETASHARLGPDSDRVRYLVRAGFHRGHTPRVTLQKGNRLGTETALAAFIGHGVVRRRQAPGMQEILELAQAPGAQLRRLADPGEAPAFHLRAV